MTFTPEGDPQPVTKRPHGGYCRLFFPNPRDATLPRARAFTYRRWHENGRFDVDFVVHDGGSPAARWLRRAAPGNVIGWRHGGPPRVSLEEARQSGTILVADATALPLVSALIERAHPARPIQVFLLPDAHAPMPCIDSARPVKVHRCRNVEEAEARLQSIGLAADGLLLAACEAGAMRRFRRLVLDELGLDTRHVFTSGYWKAGLNTEQVDSAKRSASWFGDPMIPRESHGCRTTAYYAKRNLE